MSTRHDAGRPPGVGAGLLLGIGLGGFVDGVVLHQLLQWHHMASDVGEHPVTTLGGLETNVVFDGLFHVLTWLCVVAGSTSMLHAWRSGRLAPSWSFHLGLLLAGWGLFNVVEGVVDHHLLGIHHVRDDLGGPLAWDLGFLVLGGLLVLAGWALHQAGRRAMTEAVTR